MSAISVGGPGATEPPVGPSGPSPRLPLVLLVLLFLAMAVQVAYYAPRLPDTVALHFGAGGEPDGWSSKTELFVVYGVVTVVTVGPFLILPFFLRRIPDRFVNLPRKDYWLAPDRREETFRTIAVSLLWLAVATLAFVAHVMGRAMAVNLEAAPRLGEGFWWSFGFYLAFVAVWLVLFVRRFRRIE